MTLKPAPRLRIALLTRLLDNNQPLVGDLIEECAHRSRTWFWRQLMFAVAGRTAAGAAAYLREPSRLEGLLASLAVLGILGFQVAVAGSLLEALLPLGRIERPEWLMFVVLLSFPVAWLTGKAVSRLRRKFRAATVVLCGASAAVAGLIANSMLSATGTAFFPSVGLQAGAAAVFVIGLLAGAASSDEAGWSMSVRLPRMDVR